VLLNPPPSGTRPSATSFTPGTVLNRSTIRWTVAPILAESYPRPGGISKPKARIFLVSNPGSSLTARADPRASSPAAISRTRQMATCAAMRKRRSRRPRSLPAKLAPSSFQTDAKLSVEASSAGARPNKIPVTSEIVNV